MGLDADVSKGRLERGISLGKDLFALLRDGSLFLLALMLIFFPKSLNEVLTNAGFEEGSIVGFKWKARLVETDDALKAANTTIESLQQQLKQSNDALAAATAAVPAGELREKIQQVEQSGRDVAAATADARQMVVAAIDANALLVEKAQAGLPADGGWAVVFGSDRTPQAAQDEIRRAAKAGIADAGIYLRNGYYASISVVATRELAAQQLQIAKGFRADAYVTRFARWCANPVQREGYIECAPTR